MTGLQLHPQAVGDDAVYLVPGQGLVIGDLERLADGVGIAHEPHEAVREILVVRDGPKGGAVPLDDHRLSLHHSLKHLVAAIVPVYAHRHGSLAVSVAWPYDSHRKTVFPVHPHQILFAGNLVPGIFPVGIGQGRPLGDPVVLHRFVVGRGRADVHELPRPSPEQAVVPLQLLRHKADKIAHHVEVQALQRRGRRLLVPDIAPDPFHVPRHLAVPPVQQIQFVPPQGQLPGNGAADRPCPADKQYLHLPLLLSSRQPSPPYRKRRAYRKTVCCLFTQYFTVLSSVWQSFFRFPSFPGARQPQAL